jgi:hypothetical protein
MDFTFITTTQNPISFNDATLATVSIAIAAKAVP